MQRTRKHEHTPEAAALILAAALFSNFSPWLSVAVVAVPPVLAMLSRRGGFVFHGTPRRRIHAHGTLNGGR